MLKYNRGDSTIQCLKDHNWGYNWIILKCQKFQNSNVPQTSRVSTQKTQSVIVSICSKDSFHNLRNIFVPLMAEACQSWTAFCRTAISGSQDQQVDSWPDYTEQFPSGWLCFPFAKILQTPDCAKSGSFSGTEKMSNLQRPRDTWEQQSMILILVTWLLVIHIIT